MPESTKNTHGRATPLPHILYSAESEYGSASQELVKVIADTTGAKAEYKFMPTCNYEIDYFTVTKDGTLLFVPCALRLLHCTLLALRLPPFLLVFCAFRHVYTSL